jgi:hypothetical protein
MNLPDDGDLVVFDELPADSLLRKDVVYRAERKADDREILFVDTKSGHAGRVPLHEVGSAKWHVGSLEPVVEEPMQTKPVEADTGPMLERLMKS